ncbi:SOS-response transcriptional repressor [Candidatus Scalindua japonica]|uniref:SOS-response transcriptional repressor n=1 Tax=Candidatus Scalindua japonica TaxID=1284222 RepID=A0A286U441_9BACT|nr:translesion error-prone DNA polymerase V autoproteolytic subunit [Candidatus Scalindua japonica]GAX62893.1 SOS-response transcriptional repressor [Candidatus Scalindua japonica]
MAEIYKSKIEKEIKLPLYEFPVSAGFPSPADDYIDKHIDLNEYIIKHPAATFFVRVKGNSMEDSGISSGDLVVVDRALVPADNTIVVALLNGEFVLKRVKVNGRNLSLVPANPSYEPIEITEEMDFQVWGVVTYCIKEIK